MFLTSLVVIVIRHLHFTNGLVQSKVRHIFFTKGYFVLKCGQIQNKNLTFCQVLDKY